MRYAHCERRLAQGRDRYLLLQTFDEVAPIRASRCRGAERRCSRAALQTIGGLYLTNNAQGAVASLRTDAGFIASAFESERRVEGAAILQGFVHAVQQQSADVLRPHLRQRSALQRGFTAETHATATDMLQNHTVAAHEGNQIRQRLNQRIVAHWQNIDATPAGLERRRVRYFTSACLSQRAGRGKGQPRSTWVRTARIRVAERANEIRAITRSAEEIRIDARIVKTRHRSAIEP